MNVKADAQANSGNDGEILVTAFFVPVSSLRRNPQYLQKKSVMNKKDSTQTVLALMQDAQKFTRVQKWPHAIVKLYSDYIDAEYHIRGTLRDIPDNNADEWRLYASDDELVLVFTYYYEED